MHNLFFLSFLLAALFRQKQTRATRTVFLFSPRTSNCVLLFTQNIKLCSSFHPEHQNVFFCSPRTSNCALIFTQNIKLHDDACQPSRKSLQYREWQVLKLITACLLVTPATNYNTVPRNTAHNGRKRNRTSMFKTKAFRYLLH